MRSTDVKVRAAQLWFLPVQTRVPLKFGPETLTSVICARVALTVEDRRGRLATGWGETPLSVQWVWPSERSYNERAHALGALCGRLARRWASFDAWGHALELGHAFQQQELRNIAAEGSLPVPWLAALVCCSPFDLALHDAYARLVGRPVYSIYDRDLLNHDLEAYLAPATRSTIAFAGAYPADYLQARPARLPVWHLVGGLDPLSEDDLTGDEPDDGYPVLLRDWIARDGLTCLKIKLRGNDAAWDYERFCRVGQIGSETGVDWLSADFNCTVTDPTYVNDILDRLLVEQPRLYGMLLYVEQPFPYDLEANALDVHSVSARKPLFMDESAHDWRLVRLGRELGWSGVALKTCKTQTGALLSLCWARVHGMALMVQDLTNPMLAQIPHVLLAAHAGTIMGVESNAMQFYPDASSFEARVHPGLYHRRQGMLDLDSVQGPGFGYRLDEIARPLGDPAVAIGGQ